jgi:hypothetical protein
MSAAEFAMVRALHIAAELRADGLLTIAYTEHRHAEVKYFLRRARAGFGFDARRTA